MSEEPNHKMARKPGTINYSILFELYDPTNGAIYFVFCRLYLPPTHPTSPFPRIFNSQLYLCYEHNILKIPTRKDFAGFSYTNQSLLQ
jgi:hypothetical protein